MDSRIEELAMCILERARAAAEYRGPKYNYWRRIEVLAGEIIGVIFQYRTDFPNEYEDSITEQNKQIAELRQQLSRYQEREKTMGWMQD